MLNCVTPGGIWRSRGKALVESAIATRQRYELELGPRRRRIVFEIARCALMKAVRLPATKGNKPGASAHHRGHNGSRIKSQNGFNLLKNNPGTGI
jgi:hypothetical protein